MINIYSTNNIAKEIIEKAFIRSFGTLDFFNNIVCFISPNIEDEVLIESLINQKSKILIFGDISKRLAKLIGLKYINTELILDDLNYNHNNFEDKSNLYIKYNKNELNLNNPFIERYFYRFDFTDEWNNLGYGAITTDNSIWSIQNTLEPVEAISLADIYDNDCKKSIFISLRDFETSSVLYVNREVANIDGLDWIIIENFVNRYKMDILPTLPIISDIPFGCNAVASSRLDCDQSVLNTKPLVELYKKYNINLSLAISTGIDINEKAILFLNHFYDNGGSLLSHTINHYTYWGESYEVAFDEASGSKEWLEQNIINFKELKYAVSPFHSNKPYSIQALNDCGYKGYISGIIHNDPEYLVSSSGVVPFVDNSIVTHSQQCMLHGDCYHRRNNSLSIYKNSFENYYKSSKIFGYLDHPFGEYDYAWESEEERLGVHEKFINYINSFDNLKWMTSHEILDFVVDKSSLVLKMDANRLIINRGSNYSSEKICVVYKNKEYIC